MPGFENPARLIAERAQCSQGKKNGDQERRPPERPFEAMSPPGDKPSLVTPPTDHIGTQQREENQGNAEQLSPKTRSTEDFGQ